MTLSFFTDRVLYKDDSIIVIDKPAGVPVHSGSGGGENLEQYLGELCFGYPSNPILAHRLDRDTSGCLVLGRNKEAISRLGKLFMAKRITKTYWAVVEGKTPEEPEGRINIPMRKQSPLPHRWHMEAHPEGQEAITDYKLLGSYHDFSLLELKPITGRTHQLRVHCKEIGSPIVGDKIYGDINTKIPLHLHARAISLPFYHGRPDITVTAQPPRHMMELIDEIAPSLRGSERY